MSVLPTELAEQEQLLKVVAGLVPASAGQVGTALGKLAMRLQELTDELAAADHKSTHLAEEYQLAFDKAFLLAGASAKVKVTEAVRSAEARIATYALRLDMEVAKLHVRSLRAAHRTLDRRIDVGRTCASTLRSEHRTLGYGGAP